MADPTYQMHTHTTQYKLQPIITPPASRLKPKYNTKYESTIPKYNAKLPKCFVSLGLGKIQYQNTIPNPPPGDDAAVRRHGEAVTEGSYGTV